MRKRMLIPVLIVLAGGLCAPARAADGLDSDPDYLAAAAAFANRQYDPAIEKLVSLLSRYPRHWRLQMLLADAYERTGRREAARRLYQAALTGQPSDRARRVAEQAVARLKQAPEPGPVAGNAPSPEQIAAMSVSFNEPTTAKTEHFDITTWNPTLAGLLVERAEPTLERVRRTVLGGQLYPHRIELIVHPNQAAFRKQHDAPHWSGGGFRLVPHPDGAWQRQVLLWQLDEANRFRGSLLDRELPHELAHVVLREYFGQAACPLWLDEGLACMAQSDGGRTIASRMNELLEARGHWPLDRFIDRVTPKLDSPANFYVQSASWTRFLRSRLTDAQFKTFLSHMKEGQAPSVALSRTLLLDDRRNWLADMEEQWHEWARSREQRGAASGRPATGG